MLVEELAGPAGEEDVEQVIVLLQAEVVLKYALRLELCAFRICI